MTPIDVPQVSKFYSILFDAIVSGKQAPSGRNGYYYLESGEHQQLAMVGVVAKELYAHGKVMSPEAVQLSEADLDPESYKFALVGMGINCRARGERGRQLGWKPPQTTEDFYASIQTEVDHWLTTH